MAGSVADLAALGKLLEEHRPQLLAMLQRRIDPALSARLGPEDILSDAFLQARCKWQDYKHQSAVSPYAWLYRITLDCLIEAWRRETRERRHPKRAMPWPDQSSVQLGLGLVSPGTSPSEAAVREELQRRMRQALALLKDADREILWMRHYDQLSFKEAALVLGIKESAATLRYVRAVERLKKLWQQLHPTEGEDR
jgi:RNA polymerase sigma-70 factor (ECF subfamily)